MHVFVQPAIFDKFPSTRIALVAGWELDNVQSSPAITSLLRATEEAVRSRHTMEELASLGPIVDWREAYRAFGMKPSSYRSSIESLLRRVLQGKELPSISPIVDLYNVVSLRHLIPAGAVDLDAVQGGVELTIANGNERFIRLGSTTPEPIQAGEVIYRDDEDVLCRAWNYRESSKSQITPTTRNTCLFLEGLASTSKELLELAQADLHQLLQEHCGGRYQLEFLIPSTPQAHLARF